MRSNLSYVRDFEIIVFNNNVDRFKSLAIALQSYVSIGDQYHRSGQSFFNVQKKTFSENYLNILLLYRSHNVSVEIFLRELSVTLTNNNDVDIVLGDFNMHSSNSNLMQVMNGYTEIVDHPTHIDGGNLDHVYVRNTLKDKFSIKSVLKCINFSDHDVVKIKFEILDNE